MHGITPQPQPEVHHTLSNSSPDRRAHRVGSAIVLKPHDGYRQYFRGNLDPEALDTMFGGDEFTDNFPSVRYAAGWARAEHAISARALSLSERNDGIAAAQKDWQVAVDMTEMIYEQHPGTFLLWPGARW